MSNPLIKILEKNLKTKKEQRQNLLEESKHIYYLNSLQVKLRYSDSGIKQS